MRANVGDEMDISTDESKGDSTDIRWLDLFLHPQKLYEHIEALCNDRTGSVRPTALELVTSFLVQASTIPNAKKDVQQEVNQRTKRLLSLAEEIAHKCNFTLAEIEQLPLEHQKRILLGMLRLADENDKEIRGVNLHRWTLRSISKRVHLMYLQKPGAEEELPVNRLADESFAFLHNILQTSNDVQLKNEINLDLGKFFFFAENFVRALHYLQVIQDKDEIVSSMIVASKSVQGIPTTDKQKEQLELVTQFKKTLEKYQFLINAPSYDNDKIKSIQDDLIVLLQKDVIINAMSVCYRAGLLPLLIPERIVKSDLIADFTKQVLAVNIIKEVVSMESDHITEFVYRHSYLTNDSAITLWTILFAQQIIELKSDKRPLLHNFINLVISTINPINYHIDDQFKELYHTFPFKDYERVDEFERLFSNKSDNVVDEDIEIKELYDEKSVKHRRLDRQHNLLRGRFEKVPRDYYTSDKAALGYMSFKVCYHLYDLHNASDILKLPNINLNSLNLSEYDFILLELEKVKSTVTVQQRAMPIIASNDRERAPIINDSIYARTRALIIQDMKPSVPFMMELLRILLDLNDWGFLYSILKDISTLFEVDDNVRYNENEELLSFIKFCTAIEEIYFLINQSEIYRNLIKEYTYKLVELLFTSIPSVEEYNSQKEFHVSDRIKWEYIDSLLRTSNVEFLKQILSQLSFTLLVIRKTTNRDLGHLANLTSSDDSHAYPTWINIERFIDDSLSIIIEKFLQRIIELDSNDLLTLSALGDFHYEFARYKKALLCYLDSYWDRAMDENVVKKCIACLEVLGEWTACAVMHQIIAEESGYDKRIVNDVSQLNGLQDKWLPYLWDMPYIELFVYLAHQKGDSEKEKLLLQHIQRTEMNMNNSATFRAQFIDRLRKQFLEKLYLYVSLL